MPREVTFFVDAQNAYRSARRAFGDDLNDPVRIGNFHPRKLAELIADRDENRVIREVRIYTGRPDRYLQKEAHAANVRQSNAWANAGCRVFPRGLQYPAGWPNQGTGERPREKGVDVGSRSTSSRWRYEGHLTSLSSSPATQISAQRWKRFGYRVRVCWSRSRAGEQSTTDSD